MLKTIVFLETSLAQADAKKILPTATYAASAMKGDVIKAIKNGYKRIVIIDGCFGWTPSVWHKEILMALDYGIQIFGAASMGAIRAAELDTYGMKGVGTIYSMYKKHIINADDEVAIAFSPHFPLQTIPLINIRVTIKKLSLPSKGKIFSTIKKIFYAERTWVNIKKNIPIDAYNLIETNYIDIKKEDAILALKSISELPNDLRVTQLNQNRDFTIFEKTLIEEAFNPVVLNKIAIEQGGDIGQLLRAKNLLKLLSIPKTRENLLYYQSLVRLSDDQKYTITENKFIDQLILFREKNNLLSGYDFKCWLINNKLFNSDLQKIFIDYLKINKSLSILYDYNNYLK